MRGLRITQPFVALTPQLRAQTQPDPPDSAALLAGERWVPRSGVGPSGHIGRSGQWRDAVIV